MSRLDDVSLYQGASMRAIVLLLLAACASSPREAIPPAPPPIPEPRVSATAPVNPIGEFEYATATPDGVPLKGTFAITGRAGAYTGSINAGEFGVFPITDVTVNGQGVVIRAQHPEGPLDLRLTFVGDAFTGSWQLGTDIGEMAGKRVK
jgi:hypothetical protein